MDDLRVLYVCHNHPTVRPGGAEAYALELHRAMCATPGVESTFVAKGGPPNSQIAPPNDGTPFAIASEDGSEYFLHTDMSDFDPLFGTLRDKSTYTNHFRRFLEAVQPDVVHVQHTLYLGYDLVSQVRRTLPGAAIVYTLHEMLPICHRDGQMVRTETNELCSAATPTGCHECFPDVSPEVFVRRKKLIQSHLSHVDLFVSPSEFLFERYAAWGVPAGRIRVEEYGRLPQIVCEVPPRELRNRLGFFGQFTPYKGVHILLTAVEILRERGIDVDLTLHGANLEVQPSWFRKEFANLVHRVSDVARVSGRYDHRNLPALMSEIDWVVVPSVWWENSPLVIQEAFMHKRPVICSDIGGMAEKVRDGVDGLHFPVGDPVGLADAIVRAVASPELWATLRRGIAATYSMDRHVPWLLDAYRQAIMERRAAAA